MTRIRSTTAAFASLVAGFGLAAQDRIAAPLNQTRTVTLKSPRHAEARAQFDRGRVAPSLEISDISLLLKPSNSQQADLNRLLSEQQNPSSPNHRRWLTPEEFGNRFGATQDDVDKIVSWLKSQNLKMNDVARGRNWITFSGAAQHVERAFHTEIHWYNVDGEVRFSNTAEPSIPIGLENIAAGLIGLDDFGLKSFAVQGPLVSEHPEFTAGDSHFLAPNDLALIYNITPLHAANIDGSGQKIAVVGQTAIDLDDIRMFRNRYNLPPNVPQVVLAGADPGNAGGELLAEADLDIEWAGAVARNATIVYVYARNAFTAAQYAVDRNLAPVLSMSYGACEPENFPSFRLIAQQANAQGITWIAASGDAGAAGCEQHGVSPQAVKGLAVIFPASMPEVTAVGGTQFDDSAGAYWSGSNGSAGLSALSYIPEKAWNETAVRNVLIGTGGGPSVLFPKPAWQSGPGVPDSGFRSVPDVSLAASSGSNSYLVYTGGALHSFGGTSAAAPAFAGIVTLLNHYRASKGTQDQGGLGNINPTLYRLAQTAPDAFHDITGGDNIVPCAQSSPDCNTGSFGYTAGSAYDLATGLGSVDAYALVTNWGNNSGVPTSTALAASPSTIPFGSNAIQLTATVTAQASGAAPVGTVTFLTSAGELGTVGLTGSTASLSVNASQLGVATFTITALYSGDSLLNGSSGAVTITVPAPSGSAVVSVISPNPVPQQPDPSGYSWQYAIRLTEQAGIATTLTGFTIDGVDYQPQIMSFFGTNKIAAKGTLTTSLVARALKAPLDRVYVFSGIDADGRQWSYQLTVRFVDRTLVGPAISLSGTPNAVSQNPAADPSCRWSQQLTIEERGGFWVQLTKFMEGSAELTDSIQSVFGTTRLAPFGRLQGTICRPAASGAATETFTLTGTTEFGASVAATLSASFRTSTGAPAPFSASPQAVNLSVADPSGAVSGTVDLAFSGGSPQWTVSVLPANRATQWMTVSPLSGSGPAKLNIQASAAGLAKGVYSAMLILQSPGAVPQYIDVPVTLTIGASSNASIAGIANAASFNTAFAPGMVMSIFGSQLAPSTAAANTLPLPLAMAGVSVTINGVSAPLYFVSPGQLNVQIPYEIGSGPAVLGVNNNGQVASLPFQVVTSAPGIFTAQNSLVPSGTASPGQTLSMFITGEGDVTQALGTGATPKSGTAASKLPQPRLPVTVMVGGVPADVTFAGIPSGLAGVTQINFTVPQSAPPGSQPVIVTVGSASSAPATLSVTP